ncbi:hypothetical protein Tco_0375038, partial [Tanacetum coccineum]
QSCSQLEQWDDQAQPPLLLARDMLYIDEPKRRSKAVRDEGVVAGTPKDQGPQLEEGENLNTGVLGTGRTPPGETSAPAGQAQGGPSPAFVKENIDVLRTMIKELDN